MKGSHKYVYVEVVEILLFTSQLGILLRVYWLCTVQL